MNILKDFEKNEKKKRLTFFLRIKKGFEKNFFESPKHRQPLARGEEYIASTKLQPLSEVTHCAQISFYLHKLLNYDSFCFCLSSTRFTFSVDR